MNEHISDNQWACYQKGTLTVTELLQFDAHLQTCASCQSRLADQEHVANSFASLRSDLAEAMAELNAHLEYEEIAAYLDHHLAPSDLARVETHLQDCKNCAAEVEDLRAFQQKLDAPIAANKAARPFRLADWLQTLTWRWAMPFAAVAACLLIVWIGARILRSSKTDTPEQKEIAKITEPPASPNVPNLSESLVASIKDGTSQITLDAADNLVGPPAFSPTQQQLVIAALKSGKVNLTPAPTGLKARAETLLGDSGNQESFSLVSPVGKIELSPRPQLRWQALSGATSYRVIVFNANYETVAQSETLTGTTWMLPRPLASDQIYVWQVIATKDGQEIKAPVAPAPEARFKILDQAKAKEIAAARDSHLLLGLLYAQSGMRDESEREFQILAKENPQTPIAQQLLDNLRAQYRQSRP